MDCNILQSTKDNWEESIRKVGGLSEEEVSNLNYRDIFFGYVFQNILVGHLALKFKG